MFPDFHWLMVLGLLMGCSAFCSSAESALFSLNRTQRLRMTSGTPGERCAISLLQDSERLLTALLFMNLVVNMLYFGIISGMVLNVQNLYGAGPASLYSMAALLAMITFCEMLPKVIAVLIPETIARFCSLPLQWMILVLRPLFPVLRTVMQLSKRLLFPGLQNESSLDVADLERAVYLSDSRISTHKENNNVLQNLVLLSDITAEEVMRPRMLLPTLPVSAEVGDLPGKEWVCGKLFLTEENSGEMEAVLSISDLREEHLRFHSTRLRPLAQGVHYIPWNAKVANILDEMHAKEWECMVVLNEYGETLGAIFLDEVLEALFTTFSGRIFHLTNQLPIRQVEKNCWQMAGLLTLRTFSRFFRVPLPETDATTLGGVVAESLQKIPEPGDECDWGGFHFRVLKVQPMEMKLEVSRGEKNAS